MAYEEKGINHRRVVVETPAARREVSQTEREYATPSGTPSAMVAVIAVLAVAVLGLLALLFWNMQTNENNNARLAAQQPTPQTIVQQPAQQAPVIVQQPAPATQPAPVIVNPPAADQPKQPRSNVPDDSSIQAAIDKKLQNDPTLATLTVTATVTNGKALLLGTVKSEQLKSQVERAVRSVKGVASVDNQLTVSNS